MDDLLGGSALATEARRRQRRQARFAQRRAVRVAEEGGATSIEGPLCEGQVVRPSDRRPALLAGLPRCSGVRRMSYVKGLQEVGDGLYAYLQPDGGWGWSNAGLVADGERTLLIDTLFDLALTERDARAHARRRAGGRPHRHAGQHARERRPLLRQPARSPARGSWPPSGRPRRCPSFRRRRWRRSSSRRRRWASWGRSSFSASARSSSTGIELVLPQRDLQRRADARRSATGRSS